jgi:hypothetical protein
MLVQEDHQVRTVVAVIEGEHVFGQILNIWFYQSELTDAFVFKPEAGDEFVEQIKVAEQFHRSYCAVLVGMGADGSGAGIIRQLQGTAVTGPESQALEAFYRCQLVELLHQKREKIFKELCFQFLSCLYKSNLGDRYN